MKFDQKENGDCDWIFSEEEIKIINEKKKLVFTSEALRDFGNNLVKMVANWNFKFNKDLKNKSTHSSQVDLKDDI
tara:strand:+ start:1873 stop:2097 length:225 start_codon:yes stop_codon:yes gene_type:complete